MTTFVFVMVGTMVAGVGTWFKRVAFGLLIIHGNFLGITYKRPITVPSPLSFKSHEVRKEWISAWEMQINSFYGLHLFLSHSLFQSLSPLLLFPLFLGKMELATKVLSTMTKKNKLSKEKPTYSLRL